MGDALRPLLHGAGVQGTALKLFLGAAVLGLALAVLLLLPRFGYATPFGMPDRVSWHGRDYIEPTECTTPYPRDRPLRRVGTVPGVLTGGKPIYLPHSMPKGLDPVYLYVRNGGCIHAYGLSGGP